MPPRSLALVAVVAVVAAVAVAAVAALPAVAAEPALATVVVLASLLKSALSWLASDASTLGLICLVELSR
jgi:hypothetical protein